MRIRYGKKYFYIHLLYTERILLTKKENTIMTSNERKYEAIRKNHEVLQAIINRKPKNYQDIANVTGLSWPTIKNKTKKLIEVGVLSPDIPFEFCQYTLKTMFFVGIYFNGETVECKAVNLKTEQVSIKEVLSKDKYNEYIEIIKNSKIKVLTKVTYLYYLFEQEAHVLKIAISMIGIGKISSTGERIVFKNQFVLKDSLFNNNANKMLICESVHSAYKVLSEQLLQEDIWYLYVGKDLIYLLGKNIEAISKGLIMLDEDATEAINFLLEQETDKYTICEAKEIILQQIIPFIRFVQPKMLIVSGLLSKEELKNIVYSDLKSVAMLEKIEFKETDFAKAVAISAMYNFIGCDES